MLKNGVNQSEQIQKYGLLEKLEKSFDFHLLPKQHVPKPAFNELLERQNESSISSISQVSAISLAMNMPKHSDPSLFPEPSGGSADQSDRY